MKKKDYNKKEEEEVIDFIKFETTIECTEMVDKLMLEKPDARKKQIYASWRDTIMHYMKLANKLSSFNIYMIKNNPL